MCNTHLVHVVRVRVLGARCARNQLRPGLCSPSHRALQSCLGLVEIAPIGPEESSEARVVQPRLDLGRDRLQRIPQPLQLSAVIGCRAGSSWFLFLGHGETVDVQMGSG